MRLRKIVSIAFVLVFVANVLAFGSVGVKNDTTNLGAAADLKFNNGVKAAGVGSEKTISASQNESHNIKKTTNNTTVTAAETGAIFIVNEAARFQLPSAADGLTYTFVTGAGIQMHIQVDTTPNTITFADAPDGDDSQGVIRNVNQTTGNTVTLTSDGTTWYITQRAGDFEDGGAWTAI
jgi:hypothetical protein